MLAILLVKTPVKNVNWHITEDGSVTLCDKKVPIPHTQLPMRFLTSDLKVCKTCKRRYNKSLK